MNKELRILFLKTKLENESKNLDSDSFFKLIEHKIGWKEYNDLLSEYVKNSLIDYQTHNKLTELGKNTLKTLETEYVQELKDKAANRKKLHNESVMSGWKRKTFWWILGFGLFGGLYSAYDIFIKSQISEKRFLKIEEDIQKSKDTIKGLHTLILDQKNQDSLNHSNYKINTVKNELYSLKNK